MQYDMQKLGRMTLEQLTEIAGSFGLKVGRNASLQSIIYDILDAQADKRGAEVQAREEAREERRKGKRARIQSSPQKVNTDNLKGSRVLATVGNEQDTLGQIKEEQAKQPLPRPTVAGTPVLLLDAAAAVTAAKAESIGSDQSTGNEEKPAKKSTAKKGTAKKAAAEKKPARKKAAKAEDGAAPVEKK